jgi:hypothetical protein
MNHEDHRLDGYPVLEFKRRRSTVLEIHTSNEDIRIYLDGHIHQVSSFVREIPEIEGKIKTTIIKAADGMHVYPKILQVKSYIFFFNNKFRFLLVRLHLDSLQGKTSVMEIEDAFDKIPKGEEAYRQACDEAMGKRIKDQKPRFANLALRAISWITFLKRLLSTSELQHALAVTERASTLDSRNLRQIGFIISACGGFVTVDTESDIIRLVYYYTAQEYSEQTAGTWFPHARTDITKICYLLII